MRGLKVFAVVVAKNTEKALANCLSSILEQTRQPHEVTIVDGHKEHRVS